MKKFTKQISEIIIHCTATPAGRDLHVADITRYHRERGFDTIGYHYLVALDGTIEQGRAPEYIGAHCLGHNDRSIGVVYVGGVTADMTPADTRTDAQRRALAMLVAELHLRYPLATIHGHCEFAAKACPCFDAKAEYSHL
ncbi:MAG: N-acetylmuramoyl-L-alanine amidase [Muribaculaceae bacterium]|nr:N-acetylmuramoyl-L-alanine amidase [Muribaculaceae bacterium]